jgi:hypothetical protein
VPPSLDDAVFAPIALPDTSNLQPRITRTFRFERGNGGWQINGKFMDCTEFRFQPQVNSVQRWIIGTDDGLLKSGTSGDAALERPGRGRQHHRAVTRRSGSKAAGLHHEIG